MAGNSCPETGARKPPPPTEMPVRPLGGGWGGERSTGKDKNPERNGTGARTESNAEKPCTGMTETEGKRRQVGFSSCFSVQRSKLVPCV